MAVRSYQCFAHFQLTFVSDLTALPTALALDSASMAQACSFFGVNRDRRVFASTT
jgi:hypothetical protein